MSRREIELVTALAEGRLEDESEARALIERSARLRSIYEDHRFVLESLGSLPPVSLTESEKTALRRDIWTEFRAAPTTPAPVRGRMRPAVWGYAAAFLFVSVGLVAVLNNAMGSGASSFFAADTTRGTIEGNLGSPGDFPPGSESEVQALRAATAFEIAGDVKAGNLEFDTVTNGAEAIPDWDVCADDDVIDELETAFRLMGIIEKDGVNYAVMRSSLSEASDPNDLVVIDLEDCEVAYSDASSK